MNIKDFIKKYTYCPLCKKPNIFLINFKDTESTAQTIFNEYTTINHSLNKVSGEFNYTISVTVTCRIVDKSTYRLSHFIAHICPNIKHKHIQDFPIEHIQETIFYNSINFYSENRTTSFSIGRLIKVPRIDFYDSIQLNNLNDKIKRLKILI